MKKELIDKLIEKYKVQTVGTGYFDCIVSKDHAKDFIKELDEIGVKVVSVDWWCHCTSTNKEKYGCPHGLGGPKSLYYSDWFSELTHYEKDGFASNLDVIDYIFHEAPKEKYYSPCLFPSLWLEFDPEEME